MPEAVDQVGGAVHRIQDPAGAAPVQPRIVLLLSHELDVRGQGGQALPQKRLYRHVHIGHIVRFALGPDALNGGGIGQQFPRLQYRLDGPLRQRIRQGGHAVASRVRMAT